MPDDLYNLRLKTALAHRILTMTGSMGDITGHVFVRVPGTDEMLVRGRNQTDVSPAFVEPDAIRRVDMDGNAREDLADYWVPPERFIGTTIMKTRPEINCVIHAHPPAQVLCTITGVDIRPIVGSQNHAGAELAHDGIPVYPRSLLIHSAVLGRAMMSVMGNKNVVLLKAHGNVVAGRSVEEATVNAVRLENLARLCWQVALSHKEMWEIPLEDWEDHVRPRGGPRPIGMPEGNTWNWDFYLKMLEQGATVPQESTVGLEQF